MRFYEDEGWIRNNYSSQRVTDGSIAFPCVLARVPSHVPQPFYTRFATCPTVCDSFNIVQANLRDNPFVFIGLAIHNAVPRHADTVLRAKVQSPSARLLEGQRNRIGELDETFPFRLNWRLRD